MITTTMNIKVLATKGCGSCQSFYENVCKAVEEMQLDTSVVKVDDLMGMLAYRVLSMPALIVNEQVIVYGQKLSVEEIKKQLKPFTVQ